ncbi:hypothetical protein [Paenibacillus glufosinatiresistens]|uniref:hypothetical protein n=1 Tax=Paenibacillus glufosinatiresistens TaxID=3070657 RepID=UPI00286E8CD5|nr:hypothetical protein [Paenibacillus sp. YX.27]
MKVLKITYPTDLTTISDKENDNIDVFVELEDGSNITLVVGTPKNLIFQMESNRLEYITAPNLDIIVKSLSAKTIQQAIEAYADGDAFWMKALYAMSIDKNVIEMDRINGLFRDVKHMNSELN